MHEIGGVPGAELFQKIGAMKIDGTRADAECPSGLLAGGAPDELGQRDTFSASRYHARVTVSTGCPARHSAA